MVHLTFRAKLMSIVATIMVALLGVIAGSSVIGMRQDQVLNDVESRMVPRTKLGPALEGEFDRLARGMQDAVAAQDTKALSATLGIKSRLFEIIASAGTALEAREAASLRWAIQDYYDDARAVSQRLIASEAGESLVDDIARMQERQKKAIALMKKAAGFDQNELAAGFSAVRDANRTALTLRLAIALSGLAMVLLLSLWVSRGMLQGLSHLSRGFARFATGDFSQEIPALAKDELGRAAREANQMAARLKQLAEQRDRTDWLKAGQAGLSDEIRGEIEPRSVATRALTFLARRIKARAAAVYLADDDETLRLLGHYAMSQNDGSHRDPVTRFGKGEGLVGQAAESEDLLVVDDPPEGYLEVRSGLGKAFPATLVFLPLVRFEKPVAVLEFALFVPCSNDIRELLDSIRETLVVALEAAKSGAASRDLLKRTQEQAERLAAQEEELRMNNQELQVQQEELRLANEELEAQRQALSQQNSELTEARRRVQQKVEELGKVSSYKSQFLANMSHELRTPLNSMLLLSHLLGENEAGNLTAKQVEHGKTIHSAGKDLLALINQVLDLSKIEAGKQDLEVESVEVRLFADHARRIFGPLADEKGLRLVVAVDPRVPDSISTDKLRLERILTNLLGNAVKFTEQGEVALRITRPRHDVSFTRRDLFAEKAIAFEVSDTGIGIAPEAHERIFAPFEQLEGRTDRRYSGTGLGLAIARESAGLLGGELKLESRPGHGSTFICYVPENPSPDAEISDGAGVSSPHLRKEVPDDRGALARDEAHLLIIEDDTVLAEQLVDIIRARRLKVLVAESGEEGLALAKHHRPRGIILDVKLPDIDGWTVMNRLRQDASTRSIPVHFISGVDAPERGLALGAVGYLTKPATLAELATAVRTLTPGSATSGRVLVVEDNAAEGQSIVELLQKDGLSASHVKTAAAALDAIEAENYRCMILDLGLPDMDGLELLEALRGRSKGAMPRVVVHTGRALTKRETRQLEAYAESVILKDGSSGERLLEEIRLFVRHVTASLPAQTGSREVEPSVSDISLQGIKLLVAEDDMRTVYALSALLRGKGADIVVAETGREALDVLALHPDIRGVLMDVMMPEMDGYEAMRRLRADSRFAQLPVIALTAKAMKGERERCIEAGASDYLTKPVDSQRLLSTLKTWLLMNGSHDA